FPSLGPGSVANAGAVVNLRAGGVIDGLALNSGSELNVFGGVATNIAAGAPSAVINQSGGELSFDPSTFVVAATLHLTGGVLDLPGQSKFFTGQFSDPSVVWDVTIDGGVVRGSGFGAMGADLLIRGGVFDTPIVTSDVQRIVIEGGTFNDALTTGSGANDLTIAGGTFNDTVNFNGFLNDPDRGTETVSIRGGAFNGDFYAGTFFGEGAVIDLVGSDFAIDGVPLNIPAGETRLVPERGGETLTAILEDGTPFSLTLDGGVPDPFDPGSGELVPRATGDFLHPTRVTLSITQVIPEPTAAATVLLMAILPVNRRGRQ
ncbi:MAG: hypothetical protein AAF805_03575, partial [Planctomycetota bacterium]